MSELKPCPFCGGEAQSENYAIEAAAFCTQCRATIIRKHSPAYDIGLLLAENAWNTRQENQTA